MTKVPSESGSIPNDAKKSFLLELMKQCDNQKTSLKSDIERSLSLPSPIHVRSDMIENSVDEVFRNLTKFLVKKVRKQLDLPGREIVSTVESQPKESQETISKLQTDLENESSALKEANITLANQAKDLERLNIQLKQLQEKILPLQNSEAPVSQAKISQLQNDLERERSALKEADLKLNEQNNELTRLQSISKQYDETQLWLSQILGEGNTEADLKNQVRDLVKTIIDSSKRLSKFKSQKQQTSHDLGSYQRMFVIVDLLSKEDSTVQALRILSDKEEMSIKELADATGQNSLVLKMKLRRFARSGAIELDNEGNVKFRFEAGEAPNE
ncbi:MAG: hypothetical protein ACE5OZ_12975 [Candidatus Heimdallarchaeota archaeon]